MEALIGRIVAGVAAIPFANFTALPTVAEWLVRRNFERRSLSMALETKIRASTTSAEIQGIASATIAAADLFGGRQRAGLAEALAESLEPNLGHSEVGWGDPSIGAVLSPEERLILVRPHEFEPSVVLRSRPAAPIIHLGQG